ncbi:hypothetical protein KSP40_PGU022642 [Platanthera guangdongensis]|uniref:RNase H type-1 domain-containing protein n=1 Tax=Platanthera guangdongensis TaxID=2320717 RepID=A0ABR2LDG8_9ASPA
MPLPPLLRRGCWSPPLDRRPSPPRRTGTPPGPLGRLLPCGPPPPPRGWLKINIDGALLPSRQAGVGIVARDSSGTVFFAAVLSLLQWDPGRTEMAALAVIQDYLTVDCFDASGVIIEGDYLNLIKYCQRCFDSRLWDAHFPNADVLGFLFELSRVLLRHVPRAANRAADFLFSSCYFLYFPLDMF